jgi:RNA polymerase sigma-70 factor, ECF subfamily
MMTQAAISDVPRALTLGTIPQVDPVPAHPACAARLRSVAAPRVGSPPWRRDFDRLLVAATPRLRRLAVCLGARTCDARDLVQDTLERALICHRDFTLGTNIEAWLATIMRRLYIDMHRKARRQTDPMLADLVPAPEAESRPPFLDLDEQVVWVAVERLPAVYRRPYLLFAAKGRTYQQIATDMGISPRTVGTRILRARRQLRRMLSPLLAPVTVANQTRLV